MPDSNIDIIDQIHVNTGFTTTCPVDSEIVIFREEEWFKVFIHETFHNFALDFSDMNNSACHKIVLDILSQFYGAKGDLKKSAEYDKKKADVDKL